MLLSVQAQALGVLTGSYKLPATVDATVTTSLATELWAQVWRPDTGGPYPLVILLHGNHATCGHFDAGLGVRVDDNIQYTTTGTCPAGYVVAPSHLGYNYLAAKLSASGYIVVSINANRGVNAAPGVAGDSGLNLRRGRLVLRHMQELSKWNAGTASPPPSLGFSLLGLIDFGHVGLMGHSRGGEGMRAAIAQYQDAGSPWPARIGAVTFEGLFEIGPVDGQTSRILNAVGLPWNVLLPGCDGDVADLQGVKPFDRMMLIGTETAIHNKSTLQVFGANHNFYNTQWQLSDASSCDGQTAIFPSLLGSASQRMTAYVPFIRFFLAHVGPSRNPKFGRIFDPSYLLPTTMTSITQYARGFTPSPRTALNYVVDDFNNATGTSSKGVANQSSGLTQYIHTNPGGSHDTTQRAAAVNWNTTGGFLQVNASAAGVPVNISTYRTLEFRVALRCFGSLCTLPPSATGDVDFSIALANSNGTFSTAIALKSLAVVRRPAGSFILNTVLQTVRVPLSAFTGADLTSFRGVRFTFDKTSASSIYLANVRLDKTIAGPGGLSPSAAPLAADRRGVSVSQASASDVNTVVGIRRSRVTSGPDIGKAVVEIELHSSRAFPVGGALPELQIDGKVFSLSRFAGTDTHGMVFTIPAAEFDALPTGAGIEMRVGGASPWRFGTLAKP